MKKILLIIAVAFFCSCAGKRFYPWGMTTQEFIKKNHDARFVSGSSTESIYQRILYHFGGDAEYKFFYFNNNKLVRIDGGQDVPDITIQHRY